MVEELLTQISLGAFLSIVHFTGEYVSEHLERHHAKLISLSSGVFITILFIDLLPLAARDPLNFPILLAGFVLFHSIEKYVYQRHPSQFTWRVQQLDAMGFFFVNFLNGFALVLIYDFNPQLAYFVILPLIFAELASSTLLSHVLEKLDAGVLFKMFLSSSVFLGALVASALKFDEIVANNIFAFVIGTMFYIVVRDMVPKHREGRLEYFILGAFVMYLISHAFGAP